MRTASIQIHCELEKWLRQVADRRGLPVEIAITRLLDETRMVDQGQQRLTVPEGNQLWTVSLPLRGLIYTDYEAVWTKEPAQSSDALAD